MCSMTLYGHDGGDSKPPSNQDIAGQNNPMDTRDDSKKYDLLGLNGFSASQSMGVFAQFIGVALEDKTQVMKMDITPGPGSYCHFAKDDTSLDELMASNTKDMTSQSVPLLWQTTSSMALDQENMVNLSTPADTLLRQRSPTGSATFESTLSSQPGLCSSSPSPRKLILFDIHLHLEI